MDPLTPRCGCGSLLRPGRCCALEPAGLAAVEAEAPLQPLFEQADARADTEPERAMALCVDVLELSPGHRAALWLLARLHGQAGNAVASEALLRRLVGLDPNHVGATQALALALLTRGRAAEAEGLARNAIRIAPQHPQSHNLLALAVTEAGQPRTGELHYRRALALLVRPDPVVQANLAWSLKLQGRMQEARALYHDSAAANPAIFQTWLGYARLEEADRNIDAATQCLDRAEHLSPDDPNVHLLRAILRARQGDNVGALATLDGLDQRSLGVEEWLRKGRLLDRLGRYDEAFAAWSEGKAQLRKAVGHGWQEAAAVGLCSRQRGFFTQQRLAHLPRARVPVGEPVPLFIMGFPRSGTTLTEQMLSAHPAIAAGGELPLIGEIAELMPRLLISPLAYPEALAELWMGDRREGLDDLRDHYTRRLARRGLAAGPAAFVTDKMPLNETHLGLIQLLFPDAPLLRLQRHPLDSVLSAFSHQLTHGFCCAFDLVSAARHYALVADLLQHYARELDRVPVDIRYENLVQRPEPVLTNALAQAGLAWDAACRHGEANVRYAPTASYDQVTEPLYTRSIDRWRSYRRHLEPVLPILAPLIDRLGYECP